MTTDVQPETKPQYALADRLTSHLKQDARVRAVWLEGSLGRGQGDRHSDIDLHIALSSEDLAAFRAEYETTLKGFWQVLKHHELFGGAMIGTLLLNEHDQLVALQTWLGDAANLEITQGRAQVLFDRDRTVQHMPAIAPPPEEIRRALHVEIVYFWSLWATLPAIERGELLSTAQRLHSLAHQTVLVCSLGRGRTRDVGDWRLNELLLPHERERLERIVSLSELSQAAIVAAHMQLAAFMREVGRTATAAQCGEYPEALERAVMKHVNAELRRMDLTDERYDLREFLADAERNA